MFSRIVRSLTRFVHRSLVITDARLASWELGYSRATFSGAVLGGKLSGRYFAVKRPIVRGVRRLLKFILRSISTFRAAYLHRRFSHPQCSEFRTLVDVVYEVIQFQFRKFRRALLPRDSRVIKKRKLFGSLHSFPQLLVSFFQWDRQVLRIQPWFWVESLEENSLLTASPKDRSGFVMQLIPLRCRLQFEFICPFSFPESLKLPISCSGDSTIRVSIFAISRDREKLLAIQEHVVPRNIPEATLRIMLGSSDDWRGCKLRFVLEPMGGDSGAVICLAGGNPATGQSLEVKRLDDLPKISIVTLLYRKEREIRDFVRAIYCQDYPGEVQLVVVDDCSPDQSRLILEAAIKESQEKYPQKDSRISWRIIINDSNIGNCRSRNIGIESAIGDLVLVMDCDCIPNTHFLSEHALAHAMRGVDVVIGPHNLESHHYPVTDVIARLSSNINARFREANLQDSINAISFLNCVTRNVSIKRNWLCEESFDEVFGYSSDPASGFGWEDVDLGVRLYKAGAKFAFTPHAFSVHISHAPNSDSVLLPLRSERNFAKLFEKHNDLALVARRWAVETHKKLDAWLMGNGLDASENSVQLKKILAVEEAPRIHIRTKRPLRILTYRWHPAHQYEIYKTGHQFDLLRAESVWLTPFTAYWEYSHRPMPGNSAFVRHESIDFRDYDLALLHFDENVLDWQNTNGVIDQHWGASFRFFMDEVPLPKVAVCHGTPQFRGMYNIDYCETDLMEEIPDTRQRLVDYLRDTLVICNSYQAQREWKFRNSRVIWHGFDPTEFPEANRNKGILTLGKAMRERPHYRGFFFYENAMEGFPIEHLPQPLKVQEPSFPHCGFGNEYAQIKFRNYVDAIREYSIYFNPTLRSPMPRSRGEAMMCGLATVNAKNHDVDLFINNGVNGFYALDPLDAREQLLFLVNNPVACTRIGKESRKTAIDLFNHDRFVESWQTVFEELAQ
jgi:GT2 family glycosyltransferase